MVFEKKLQRPFFWSRQRQLILQIGVNRRSSD